MTFSTYYDSLDVGLGSWNNTTGVGGMVAFLDKVLVNGYNATTLTSMTAVGTLVTATLANHGYRDRQFVTISGASPAAYNGTWQVNVNSASANTFQFNTASPPGGSATGTIGCIVAPLGWSLPFTGANLRSYKQGAGNGFYLAVDDTSGSTQARFTGYEVMTAVATGSNLFPTSVQFAGGVFASKSNTGTSTKRCILIGNQKSFWLFDDYLGDNSGGTVNYFGDGIPINGTDPYFTCNMGQGSAGGAEGFGGNYPALNASNFVALAGSFVARSYTATAGAISCNRAINFSFGFSSGASGGFYAFGGGNAGNMALPNYSDGNIWTSQIVVLEGNGSGAPRGYLPGCVAPLHSRPLTNYAIIQGTGVFAGKEYMVINMGASTTPGQGWFEVSNTWG